MWGKDEDIPSTVKKREIFLFLGIIAAWVIVVVLLVRQPKKDVVFKPSKSPISAKVKPNEFQYSLIEQLPGERKRKSNPKNEIHQVIPGTFVHELDQEREGIETAPSGLELIVSESEPPKINEGMMYMDPGVDESEEGSMGGFDSYENNGDILEEDFHPSNSNGGPTEIEESTPQ